MKIAINGCGIGGPTLAWWLKQYGHEPIIFEQSPALRTGGYIIDFWGSGYDIAEKMGLIPALQEDAYLMESLRTVDTQGKTTSNLNAKTISELTDNRYFSIARSDLAKQIFKSCTAQGSEIQFDTTMEKVEEQEGRIQVQLSNGELEDFDLVIGADGLHSHIRELVFENNANYETHLGCYVAAFTLPAYQPRDELAIISHTMPDRYISRVSLRNDRTLFLFIFDQRFVPEQSEAQIDVKVLLQNTFKGMGWESQAILSRLDEVEDIYFDRVSQIKMSTWSKGRVALLGDAAACASLLSGEGTGLAMTEAYILAGELHRAAGNHKIAFQAYEDRLQAYVLKKQNGALRYRGYFIPKSKLAITLRDCLTRIISRPFLAKVVLGSSFKTAIDLPDYTDLDKS